CDVRVETRSGADPTARFDRLEGVAMVARERKGRKHAPEVDLRHEVAAGGSAGPSPSPLANPLGRFRASVEPPELLVSRVLSGPEEDASPASAVGLVSGGPTDLVALPLHVGESLAILDRARDRGPAGLPDAQVVARSAKPEILLG